MLGGVNQNSLERKEKYMFKKIKNTYLDWKFKKHLEKQEFNLNLLLEAPEYLDLVADIMETASEPKVFTMPSEMVDDMLKENMAPSYLAMNEEEIDSILSNEGRVMAPISVLNADILDNPELNIIALGWDDVLPREINDGIDRIAQDWRLTVIGNATEPLIISPHICNQLVRIHRVVTA